MIVFGTAVTNTETYERYAMPGIRRAAEADSVVIAHHTAGSVFRNYNLLLDRAAAHEELEALVLLHQDVELVDEDFADKVRAALGDPDVAIVGCAGALGVRSIAWWQGALIWAGLTHRYPEYGGGEFPAISWSPKTIPSYASPGEVDSLDGLVMVLSPWAVRMLRFDESLGKLHGYDFDICMQAKAAGKKVVTADFRAIHHHSLELIKDPETWIQTHIRLAEKWEELLPDTGATPHQRALRAEAEAACARAIMVSFQYREKAIERQLDRTSEELRTTRELLDATRHELEAKTRDRLAARAGSNGPARAAPDGEITPAPLPAGKARAIDYVVDELGVESFASLETGSAHGQYAFYAIEKAGVQRGTLVDVSARQPGALLLSTLDRAAEHPGMRVLDGAFADARTLTEIGEVDAVLLFDVLLRLVEPDWDRTLELYAPITSSFVIANPQWEGDGETTRLIELGREKFLEAVPPWGPHLELFDRLHEWHSSQQRPYRDTTDVWQWGITNSDLETKMAELGFSLARQWDLHPVPGATGFTNKALTFTRSDAGAGG